MVWVEGSRMIGRSSLRSIVTLVSVLYGVLMGGGVVVGCVRGALFKVEGGERRLRGWGRGTGEGGGGGDPKHRRILPPPPPPSAVPLPRFTVEDH